MDHAQVIDRYYAAWLGDDLDAVLALCTEDVVAETVPMGRPKGRIVGKPAVHRFFTRFGVGMSHKRYDVARVLVSGDIAVVEGVENYVKQGKQVSLPYMTVFEFAGGLISEWRDYFDMQTLLRQLELPLDGSRPAPAAAGG